MYIIGGFITIINYSSGANGPVEQFEILTEDNNDLSTETLLQLLTEASP